jgi:hypothetical protein
MNKQTREKFLEALFSMQSMPKLFNKTPAKSTVQYGHESRGTWAW